MDVGSRIDHKASLSGESRIEGVLIYGSVDFISKVHLGFELVHLYE